ncbi:MAG TPA: carboxyltransferase domain-containing protein [Devosia sp.]|nr:carboxyltransferase domain-containing protein [Devosia sp.]
MSPTAGATVLPLGDRAMLIRFADTLSDEANRSAIMLARALEADPPAGVLEIAPGLVSVLLRLEATADFGRVRGEVMLRNEFAQFSPGVEHRVPVRFDGDDLAEVAARLSLSRQDFIERHNRAPLRVLATGFAPGFVYCGLHPADMVVPRRESVRPMAPGGTVLFAAGQTAIAATPIRTGWHVIGQTPFQNFDPSRDTPTRLRAGDLVRFEQIE